MRNIELLSAISWHLECLALAAGAIGSFRPPADLFQMRMNYSLYLTNFMSAIDLVCEAHGARFESALRDSLKTSDFSGAEVLDYMRELRNGIVHRGMDPTSGGEVMEGIVCAIAPPAVWDRHRSRCHRAPTRLMRDLFIHCEIGALPTIEQFLESTFEEVAAVKLETMLNNAVKIIDASPHMPDWAKALSRERMKPEMLTTAQAHQLQKLRGLLKPRAGLRIA